MSGPRCTKSNSSWAHQKPFLGFIICIKYNKVGKMSSSSRLSELGRVSLQQSLPCPLCLSQGRSTMERKNLKAILWVLGSIQTWSQLFLSFMTYRTIWPISTACNRSITCQRWNELAIKYCNWKSKTKSHCYQRSHLNTISNLWDQRGKCL